MLEHMSPWEYTEVRKVLGHGSGFDSPGFKELRRVAKPLGEAFHAAHERAGLTLVEVYTRGRELEELYQLAEQLIELDERIIVWRVRHFKVVQRVIGGDVIGTQGTPVEVMGRLIHHSFFPELWDVRNELTQDEPARMSFAGVALGCGNFGGVGSSPAFFGQGSDGGRGVRDHGPRLGRRHPLVRHRRRLRRRAQRVVHRPLARGPAARGARR